MDLQLELQRLAERFGRLWDEFPEVCVRPIFYSSNEEIFDSEPVCWPSFQPAPRCYLTGVTSLGNASAEERRQLAEEQMLALARHGDDLLRRVCSEGLLPSETEDDYGDTPSSEHWFHSLLAALPDADVQRASTTLNSSVWRADFYADRPAWFSQQFALNLSRLPAAVPDGPMAPDRFHFQGKSTDRFTDMPFRLLQYLWTRSGQTSPLGEELTSAVWLDHAHTPSAEQVRAHASAINREFEKVGIPLHIRVSKDRATIETISAEI